MNSIPHLLTLRNSNLSIVNRQNYQLAKLLNTSLDYLHPIEEQRRLYAIAINHQSCYNRCLQLLK